MASQRPALGPANPNLQSHTFVPPPYVPHTTPSNAKENQVVNGKKPAASAPAAPAAPAAPKPASTTSKKRKSDATDSNVEMFPAALDEMDEDPRLNFLPNKTCNAVRKLIRDWTSSGAMKVGEYQNAIGVSSKAYGSFMNRTGTWDGQGCDTYIKSLEFFYKRELLGLPMKAPTAKKAKPTPAATAKAADLLDIEGVELPGEDSIKIPIYDTCDEVRKKMRALLAHDGVTQAAFLRELSKCTLDDKNISAANLRYFMGRKGPLEGNTTSTFYAGYVFFEKRRIKTGKPKSKFREEMEEVHDWEGVDTEHNSNTSFVVSAATTAIYVDKYGKIRTQRAY